MLAWECQRAVAGEPAFRAECEMSEVVCWQIIPGSSSIALLLVRGDCLDTMTTITIILSDNTVIISDVEGDSGNTTYKHPFDDSEK